jgi:hypothetical protein
MPEVRDLARHLDLYDLAPQDRSVALGVRVAHVGESGKRTLGPMERREFRFPGELPVPTIIRLLAYEERTKAAIAITDTRASELACQTIINEAYDDILNIARGLNEIEPDVELDINAQQLLILLGWLAGNVTVAQAVIDAITAGKTAEEIAETLTSEGLVEKAAPAGDGAELGSGPLQSPTRS